MPSQPPVSGPIEQMASALALMNQALGLLDDARAPAHVGAHLDLAIVRLSEAIGEASGEPAAIASRAKGHGAGPSSATP